MSMPAVAALDEPRIALPKQLLALRWLWCLAAVALLLVRAFAGGKTDLALSLGDTDDATRLVEVKALIASGAWFDMKLASIGGAEPLVSHWSRLIDAPLALLLMGLGLVTTPENALLLTRIIWPSLLLLVFFRLLVGEAEARAGMAAGAVCLVLAVTCLTGLFQFRPGRIDHHNAMILGTVIGLAMLARGLDAPRVAASAGVALGLALAVGFEPLAFVLPLLALVALAATIHAPWLPAVAAASRALAATFALVFLATVAPLRWFDGACDALALNMVMLTSVGAVGMTLLATRGASWSLASRLVTLVLAGSAAGALYLAVDPVCIGGPFARVSAEARTLWLVNVKETHSLLSRWADGPTLVLSFLGLVATGLWAAISRWRKARTAEAAATAVVMLAAIPPALLQVKFLPYASFVAVLALALRIAAFQGTGEISALTVRLTGLLACNQWTLALLAAMLATAVGAKSDNTTPASEACYQTPNVAPLSRLPADLVASSANLGPYIAALTPHAVLAAPYHRIDRSIVDSIRLFEEPAGDAERRLAANGARYLAFCAAESRTPSKPGEPESLENALAAGHIPPFLREIPTASPLADLRVFEVTRAAR